jgi:CDP-6-deoxy-D-xylo-4-hexulose-3-dehydrase
VIRQLEARRITTHLLFTGNLVRQPAYPEARSRVAALPINPDFTMNQVFWIDLYPGLGAAEIEYALESLHAVAAAAVGLPSRL